MMPHAGPEIPGMTVAARYVPTGGGLQVGGDWYDMIPLPGGAVRPGHRGRPGPRRAGRRADGPAADRAPRVRLRGPPPRRRALPRLPLPARPHDVGDVDADDDRACASRPACTSRSTPRPALLEIARAGHPDPAIRMADGTVLIRPTAGGLPLGIDPDADYPTTRLALEPGETMMLCTDGLIETGGHDLDTGWARIRTILEGRTTADLEELADALVQAVHGPSSHHTTGPLADRREDDIAVLLLRRTARAAAAAALHRPAGGPAHHADGRAGRAASGSPRPAQQLRELLHDWPCATRWTRRSCWSPRCSPTSWCTRTPTRCSSPRSAGEPGDRRMRVEVATPATTCRTNAGPGELASSGRGLVLIEMLADAWGVDPRGEGKTHLVRALRGGRRRGRGAPAPETRGGVALPQLVQHPECRRRQRYGEQHAEDPGDGRPRGDREHDHRRMHLHRPALDHRLEHMPLQHLHGEHHPSAHSAMTNPRSASATSTATAPERNAPR